jgi:hypothetical protein
MLSESDENFKLRKQQLRHASFETMSSAELRSGAAIYAKMPPLQAAPEGWRAPAGLIAVIGRNGLHGVCGLRASNVHACTLTLAFRRLSHLR